VAAIPDAGGARCAPRGVMRALSRLVVLGGLVVAGWLLGSGVGLASESLGHPGTGLVQPAGDPGPRAARPDEGTSGQLGASPAVVSAVTSACSAVGVPLRSLRPPARLDDLGPGVLTSVVDVTGDAKPLARVVESRVLESPALASRTLAALSRPAEHDADVRSRAPADEPAAVPPAEPTTRVAIATAPAPILGPSARPAIAHTTVDRSRAVDLTRATTADPLAGWPALGDNPSAPVPVSPAGRTTSVLMTGGTGSGASPKSASHVAVSAGWASAGPAPGHRPRYLSAGDLPQSPAARPSTSPG